ncbi:MAG: FtsW/RodA/SpoVE family cell cycle protein [Bacillota bacterium]|nr:FtsW/RodA/SpoVE family cell cycle protein [Bacillota bacterium]
MGFLSSIFDNLGAYYTFAVRWVLVILGVFILLRCIRSLLQGGNTSEIWAYLDCPDGKTRALRHWENVIGRARSADVVINLVSISRNHGILVRDDDGNWTYNDLDSKNGSAVNGEPVIEPVPVRAGDVLTIGGANFTLMPVSLAERRENIKSRIRNLKPVSPWPVLLAITLFQLLTAIQFIVAGDGKTPFLVPFCFVLLTILMWAYVIFLRSMRRRGFEMEMIAFFLSTLSLAITASRFSPDAPGKVMTQLIAIVLGVILFFALCWFLRDLDRAKKIRMLLVVLGIGLLLFNLVFGTNKFGAANWVSFGGLSLQPSELVKIAFIYIGAGTLDELFEKKNLTIFVLFSVFCLGTLALMGDFGTAAIFFVTFLIISFLRSGDLSRLIFIVGAAVLAVMLMLRFKPYIADRFSIWGHVWEDPLDKGFQQTQALISVANGGLLGNGAGEGYLSSVGASETDLVFGFLSEEFGVLLAVLAVLAVVTLSLFAVRSIKAGRSAYYTIAACAATSMFLFQVILNVFGSLDIIPLTGVTFPFLSYGGTSMMVSWGLLAFLKAADTRQNASFAIKLDVEKERERLKAKDDAEIDGEYEEDRDEFLEEYGASDGYSADYDGRGYSDDYYDGRSAPVDYDDYSGGHYSRSRRGQKR